VAEHAEQQREVLRAAAEDAGHPEIHGHCLREPARRGLLEWDCVRTRGGGRATPSSTAVGNNNWIVGGRQAARSA
jgi:hypothetical protein